MHRIPLEHIAWVLLYYYIYYLFIYVLLIKVLPHIDSKKCKSPEALVPFEWEKEARKKKAEQELKNNEYAIKNMIGKSIFGDDNK